MSKGSVGWTVRIWDDRHVAQLTVLYGHKGPVWSVAWSSDGHRLATASEDHTARVWDAAETSVAEASTRVFRELTDEERRNLLLTPQAELWADP